MELIVCEISLTEVRFKCKQKLLQEQYFQEELNNLYYYKQQFDILDDIIQILKESLKLINKNEIWFTGVAFTIFKELQIFLNKQKNLKFKILDYIECTIKYFSQQFKNTKNLYAIDFISVDKFIDTPLVKKLAFKYKSVEKVNYPFYIADIRKNIKLFKVYEDGKYELIAETIIGELSFLSLIQFLKKQQNLDWQNIDDLMLNYLSYDVDITVGDIYGQDFQGFLMKNLVASSMGKNDGTMSKSFLKSFCYNTAFQLSNLVAMLIKQEKPNQKVQTFVEMDICKHPFSFFFINSIINFYSQNYKFADIQPVFIKNKYNSCLDFCNQFNK